MGTKIRALVLGISFGALSFFSHASEVPLKLKSGESACFERAYSTPHLKMHPKQTVRWIRIEHAASKDGYIYADVKARFVGDRRLFSDGGSCSYEDNGDLVCGIDCDGGRYSLTERNDGKIIMRPIGRVRVTACGGDEDSIYREIQAKDDHNMFILDRVPNSQCKLKTLQ
jgi:hypothetical protein